jgi:ATP-dependent DNA helicase PIF1
LKKKIEKKMSLSSSSSSFSSSEKKENEENTRKRKRQEEDEAEKEKVAAEEEEEEDERWIQEVLLMEKKDNKRRKLLAETEKKEEKEKEKQQKKDTCLSEEQKLVAKDVIENKKNILLTGSAGTGKSFLLKHIIEKTKGPYTAVTASTGIAAVPINGTTLHRWHGLGIINDDDDVDYLCGKIRKNPKTLSRWQKTKLLIVDEVSMVSLENFKKLEEIGRRLRNPNKVFGGIQILLCGDFYQLAPVKANPLFIDPKFYPGWIDVVHNLQKVFRQSDSLFISALNDMRKGTVSENVIQVWQACKNRQLDSSNGVVPTKLYPKKDDVSRENNSHLSKLTTRGYTYNAIEFGEPKLLENFLADSTLTLKVGAQVLLVTNLDVSCGLCNGSRGVVVDFCPEIDPASSSSSSSSTSSSTSSDSSSSSNDFTIEIYEIDSNEKTSENEKDNKKDGKKEKEDKKPIFSNSPLPIVQFENGMRIVVDAFDFNVKEMDKIIASRKQIPLMLAWALTVHKCQGMSLDQVEMNLDDCFENGQAYVSISRARSMNGLCIRYQKSISNILKYDSRVTAFFNSIATPSAPRPQFTPSSFSTTTTNSFNRNSSSSSSSNSSNRSSSSSYSYKSKPVVVKL